MAVHIIAVCFLVFKKSNVKQVDSSYDSCKLEDSMLYAMNNATEVNWTIASIADYPRNVSVGFRTIDKIKAIL